MLKKENDINLLTLLSHVLCGCEIEDDSIFNEGVYLEAARQGILPMLFDLKDKFSPQYASVIEVQAGACVNQTMRLAYLSRYFIKALNEADIEACLIKGADLAGVYPVAELRSFSDVDILIGNQKKADKALEVLEKLGCTVNDRQDSKHHVSLTYEDKYEVELHIRPVRSFDNETANKRIDEIYAFHQEDLDNKTIFGMEIPVLPLEKSALYNLLHMLQHYMNTGFGLSHVCDFAAFMVKYGQEPAMEKYKEYLDCLGLSGFSNLLCNICYLYLKVPMEKLPYTEKEENLSLYSLGEDSPIDMMLEEIFACGKYGMEDRNRVVNVKKNSIGGLFSEFHHQTRENFPYASDIILLWPVLWLITLVKFMRNNRKVRNTSTVAVIKNSMGRSKLSGQLNLWEGVE